MTAEIKIILLVALIIGCAGLYAKWKSDKDDNDINFG